MVTLTYETLINSTAAQVWQTLTAQESYKQWVKAFSPNSQFEGRWEQGSEMKFFDPNIGGTFATLTEVVPGVRIVAEHTATVTKDGIRETNGDMTEKWIGSRESYHLHDLGAQTRLVITIETDSIFRDMFDKGWPKAIGPSA